MEINKLGNKKKSSVLFMFTVSYCNITVFVTLKSGLFLVHIDQSRFKIYIYHVLFYIMIEDLLNKSQLKEEKNLSIPRPFNTHTQIFHCPPTSSKPHALYGHKISC